MPRPSSGRRADGSWTLLDEVEAGVVPSDLERAFDGRPGSRGAWDGFPWSARRGMLEWLVTAKRDATRAKRVAAIAEAAERGERAMGSGAALRDGHLVMRTAVSSTARSAWRRSGRRR